MRTATLQEEEHGLTEAALDETDVLLWWGHTAHDAATMRWRSAGEGELVWTVDVSHPITEGVPNPIVIPEQVYHHRDIQAGHR